MLRGPPLPLLPGNSVYIPELKERYPKPNHFKLHEGQFFLTKFPKTSTQAPFPSIYAKGEGTDLPAWIVYDKMILAFEAYLKEHIPETKGYNYIIRKCKIYFFLEDGSIKVVEQKNPKSPFPQVGCIISRQKIRFPETGNSDDYYDILDFNIGKSVELVGRLFHITNCDSFTRTFLNRLGIPVPDPINLPDDPFEALQLKEKEKTKKIRNERKLKTLDEFLSMDSRLLTFDAYWDDRQTTYGYLHLLKIYYYLAEDAIEIKDVTDKDKSFTIVKKCKLPKGDKELPGPGNEATSTVLNVIGTNIANSWSMMDPLNLGRRHKQCYTDKDLAIGAVINAYGKRVVIYDCDKFTQEYYRVKYGLDNFTPLERPKTIEEEELSGSKSISMELPPYNGFGTYEDSVINCMTIIPYSIVKSYKQFYEKDKEGYESKILRFAAKLLSNVKMDEKRNFVICYYLVDDTISVFETAKDCFDCLGTSLMSRRKMFKPGQEMFGSKTPECYNQLDFFLGNTLTLESHTFILTSADEYAFKYMETHSNEFPKSNINLIMDKIKEHVRPSYKQFAAQFFQNDSIPTISYFTLRNALKQVLGDKITEQEIMTVTRHYQIKEEKIKFTVETLRRCTHDELKRKLYDEFERLRESFLSWDPERKGKVSREATYTILRGAKIPLDTNLINFIITVFSQCEESTINYDDLLRFLNYKKYPTTPLMPINIPGNMSWLNLYRPDYDTTIDKVDVKKFIDELNLEEELKQQSQ